MQRIRVLIATLRVAAAALLAAVALAPGPDAYAATFTDLYRITVDPVEGAADPRLENIRAAMGRLLTRVTGSRDARFDPDLAPLIEEADDFVNQYGQDRQGRIRVDFNASRLAQALMALNRPVWGPERPLTLLWVAFDNGLGERALLGAGDPAGAGVSPEMAALMKSTREELTLVAEERGLPIAFPLLDVQDLAAIGFPDVWGGFEEPVRAASARYAPDAILIGRVRASDFGPEVQWLLLGVGERRLLAGSTIREGLDWAADLYASQYAVLGEGGTTRITVLDVTSFSDYGRVMSYLESLSVLQSVDVEALEGDVLSLRVAARGDASVLERVLGLGGVLRRAEQPGPPGTLLFEVERGTPQ
ncbi:MAG TPA: DUF2066 domain-containing protein [Gammaproteobacteria bacterium]